MERKPYRPRFKKPNIIIAIVAAAIFIAGYVICSVFFSTVPMFSYTAEWTARHYFLFVWAAAILFTVFELPCAALTTTAGCFIGIVLGDIIGQKIIDNNWSKIYRLIEEGVPVKTEYYTEITKPKQRTVSRVSE